MERFGVVLVAAFAAGMLCGPVSCVIYSRLRRHRRFRPGPRQLKNARKQLVAVAECSSRLGAQKWETAMTGPTTTGGGGGVGAEDQAGPPSGRSDDKTNNNAQAQRFGEVARDEAAMASLECSICIGLLFPQSPETEHNASDIHQATSSTRATANGNDGAALLNDGEPRVSFWNKWTGALRHHMGRIWSSPSPSTTAQPEMATVQDGRLYHGVGGGGQLNGGEVAVVHPQSDNDDDHGRRVQTGETRSSTAEKNNGVDTPDSTPSDGADPGRYSLPLRSGMSQGGNVLEGGTDSHAKPAMTPVSVATLATRSPSAEDAASAAPAQPPVGQPVDSLTAPGPAPSTSADGHGTAGPRDARSRASTEAGRSQPSSLVERSAVGRYSFPRRPMEVVKRAGQGVLTLTRNVSRRASSADDSDLDTEILVLRGCHHAFHARCLISWFLTGGFDCPVCRAPYWMRREQLARALYNERNGITPSEREDDTTARTRSRPGASTATERWMTGTTTMYAGLGGAYLVVNRPERPVYATDRRAWEVYIP